MAAFPLPINEFLSTGDTCAADLAFVPATTGSPPPHNFPHQGLRDRNDRRCFEVSGGTHGTLHRACGWHVRRSSAAALQRPEAMDANRIAAWSLALIGGLDTYYAWYIESFR